MIWLTLLGSKKKHTHTREEKNRQRVEKKGKETGGWQRLDGIVMRSFLAGRASDSIKRWSRFVFGWFQKWKGKKDRLSTIRR